MPEEQEPVTMMLMMGQASCISRQHKPRSCRTRILLRERHCHGSRSVAALVPTTIVSLYNVSSFRRVYLRGQGERKRGLTSLAQQSWSLLRCAASHG